MKCFRCGYESTGQFTQCPACGAVQPTAQTFSQMSSQPTQKMKAGEIIAIVVSIIVSIVSVMASIVIFLGFSDNISENKYGIDAYDDFDSNEYDDIEKFFRDYYSSDSSDDSSTGLDSPLTFKEKLYSFSEGEVETEYTVSLIQTYRGEAAMKLLEGETLPIYDEFSNDIYLVKFRIAITDQEKDAIVPIPQGNPVAYPKGSTGLFSEKYDTIENLSYANRLRLIKKGEEVETWMAFIVSKNDSSPCIRWNSSINKEFCNTGSSITDPSEVESGAAIELTSSESSED